MSRRKRKLEPGCVQASARAVVSFVPATDGARAYWRWWAASGGNWWARATLAECIEQIRAIGFGAYTCEGKTVRLRSRYVAGDRPPP